MFSANEFRGRKWPAMLLASRCVHPWLAFAMSESQSVPVDCFENKFGLPGFSLSKGDVQGKSCHTCNRTDTTNKSKEGIQTG